MADFVFKDTADFAWKDTSDFYWVRGTLFINVSECVDSIDKIGE